MTLQLSTVAPLDAITRACNSVAGQAQTARRAVSSLDQDAAVARQRAETRTALIMNLL